VISDSLPTADAQSFLFLCKCMISGGEEIYWRYWSSHIIRIISSMQFLTMFQGSTFYADTVYLVESANHFQPEILLTDGEKEPCCSAPSHQRAGM